MNDPKPGNIQGVVKHSVDWEVNVSHLLFAIAAIYAIHRASQHFDLGDVEGIIR